MAIFRKIAEKIRKKILKKFEAFSENTTNKKTTNLKIFIGSQNLTISKFHDLKISKSQIS